MFGRKSHQRADADGTLQVTLRLKSIDNLFTAPDLSPFDPYYSAQTLQAGADFLIAEMERTPRLKRTELTVILPPAEIAADPELPARTREALGRYASAWAAEARQSHAVDLRKARLAAQSTIVFFVLANLLSFRYAHTGSLFGLTGAWVEVLMEGISVGAWVALWWPLDQLFTVWQHRLDENVYRTLKDIELRIVPDTDPAAAD